MSRKHPNQNCELCQQQRDLTFHHLIPRKLHRRTGFKRRFDAETLNQGIHVCNLCHRGLHRLYDELTLAREFNHLDAILGDGAIAKHVAWSAKQKVKL